MNTYRVTDVVLWLLLAAGFLGAVKISYANITGNLCPHIAFVPICYVVMVAYGLMIGSIIIKHKGCKHYFFMAGWGVAFVIALTGSLAELVAGGGVCPVSGGAGVRGASNSGSIPLCYVSLVFLLIILALFLMGPYKRLCDAHNSSEFKGRNAEQS